MLKRLKNIRRFLSPHFQSIHLDYPVDPKPRWGHGLEPHGPLYSLIDSRREDYRSLLSEMLRHQAALQAIRKCGEEKDPLRPCYNNGFFPGLDIAALYALIARYRPARYVEVGSGNSTKVAALAVSELNTGTLITSIDPAPRAEIDALASRIVRQPFETAGLDDILSLEANDILFIDNSHRVLPNSDATVFFLEVLPLLKPGVIVHIHDIYLPYDYPPFMCECYYSEQYLLAAFLLSAPGRYRTLLPNYFVSLDPELSRILLPLWEHLALAGVETHGGSYWLQLDA